MSTKSLFKALQVSTGKLFQILDGLFPVTRQSQRVATILPNEQLLAIGLLRAQFLPSRSLNWLLTKTQKLEIA